MISSTRQAIACVLLIFVAAVCSQSQVAPAKTATISGKVTLKTRALAGIIVSARPVNSSVVFQSRLHATTDQTGKYRITNVPPGTYEIVVLAPGLVLDDVALTEKSVVVEEGDSIDDVNFSMARGGVITGKITDADGKPMIEQQVFLEPVDGPYEHQAYYHSGLITDDRGFYRAFGVRPGKYKIFVGQNDNAMTGGSKRYRKTFYPSVTDVAKATAVEVTEETEAIDIDITMGRPFTAFKVTGKIVDGETGRPLPNIGYGINQRINEYSSQSSGSALSTNANGEFKFEGLMPGKYSIFISPGRNTEVYADQLPFEVVDRDLTGLVLKTLKGLSVSGVVVLEGVEDPAAIAKLGNLYVSAMTTPREGELYPRNSSGAVGPDGRFKLGGLSPGVIHFGLGIYRFDGGNKQIALVRIEHDGILHPNRISIKEGEETTGVRLIVKTLTAVIRGQVKIEDGELPANARMSIWVQPVEDGRPSNRVMHMNSSPQIDSRGRFLIEGVAGGTYEINVGVFEPGRQDSTKIFRQQVTVADNSVTETTVTIKLKP